MALHSALLQFAHRSMISDQGAQPHLQLTDANLPYTSALVQTSCVCDRPSNVTSASQS